MRILSVCRKRDVAIVWFAALFCVSLLLPSRSGAQALSGKCWCLYRMRDRDRFAAAVDELCDRYENAEDPQLRIASGYGLQLKAWWLLHNGRGIDAIAIGERLAARFVAETDATPGSGLLRCRTR